jgi:hypothetical protein
MRSAAAAERCVEVVLLTRDDCAFCEDAAAILHRLGAEFPLAITCVDYDSEEGHRLALSGGMLFPPGIVIGGRPFSYGRPSERKLRRELAGRSAREAVG